MTQDQIVRQMAKTCGMTIDACHMAYKAFLYTLEEALANGEKVRLDKIGTFTTKCLQPRYSHFAGRVIPSHKSIKFTPCKKLKQKMNGIEEDEV